ncbi:hypothetical protein Poli38472_011744 [Pythium oligandrum]|uniref:Uncharacterized protein n=1 Tax=Pythium oligandrum TaxID=41045 RepID=A0A8K1FDC0_PYTOL|nr:hypothetical protein Poli38472_011744 [Pythium oligandrum]|eukprot:TMW58156.1 hypothetical protein Poli38472_011744 [Pythium oligandrum]
MMNELMDQASRVDSRLVSARTASIKATRAWQRVQIELKGELSIQRLDSMREYIRETNWQRVLLVFLVTPLPALIAITVIDCSPLASPENGPIGNHVYWIRMVVVIFILGLGVLQHARCCIPQLPMSHLEWLVVSFIASHGSVPLSYCVSLLIGFPVPFSLVVNASIAYPIALASLWLLWHKAVRANPQLKSNLYRQMLVLMGQVLMMFVFPLYFFVFKLLPPRGQPAFTLLIPIIKLGLKNYFNATLKDVDDIKPAFIVFNIDLFSALYVANCLQASQSKTNLAIVMAVDVAQMALSMYELRRMMKQIQSLVRLDKFDGSLLDLCVVVSGKPGVQAQFEQRTSSFRPFWRVNTRIFAISTRQILPASPSVATVQEALAAADFKPVDAAALMHKITKVLYMVEFYLLIEFAEVMIPIIYCIYMVVMSHLPNRAYYPQLATLTSEQMLQSITTVILYAALELLSLLVLLWLIHWQVQLPTPHLLAFALEKQRVIVHSSLVVWILYIIQQSLQHSGTDFSLRFEWLKQSKNL